MSQSERDDHPIGEVPFCSDDMHQKLTLDQLAVAKNSNVLMFARDPSKFAIPYARKLRPEFEKFFVTSELNDCVKILSKVTNDSLDKAAGGVNLVVCDVDAATLRLVDIVSKRPSVAETSNCPLIPVVVLRNQETADPDMLKQLSTMGGNTAWFKILDVPCTSMDLLFTVIELLYRRSKVESTFDSLQKKHVISAKYPYWDIFGNKKSAAQQKAANNEPSRFSTNGSHQTIDETESALEHRLDDGDDWTETGSLLPNFVLEARENLPDEHHRARLEKSHWHLLKGSEDYADIGKPGFNSNNASDVLDHKRYRVPQSVLDGGDSGMTASGGSGGDGSPRKGRSASFAAGFKAGIAEGSAESPPGEEYNLPVRPFIGNRLEKSEEVAIDIDHEHHDFGPFEMNDSSLANTSQISNNAKEDAKAKAAAKSAAAAAARAKLLQKRAAAGLVAAPVTSHARETKDRVIELLNPANRPYWESSAIPTGLKPVTRDDQGNSADLTPFVYKPLPQTHIVRTVNGLDKRTAETAWKSLKTVLAHGNSSVVGCGSPAGDDDVFYDDNVSDLHTARSSRKGKGSRPTTATAVGRRLTGGSGGGFGPNSRPSSASSCTSGTAGIAAARKGPGALTNAKLEAHKKASATSGAMKTTATAVEEVGGLEINVDDESSTSTPPAVWGTKKVPGLENSNKQKASSHSHAAGAGAHAVHAARGMTPNGKGAAAAASSSKNENTDSTHHFGQNASTHSLPTSVANGGGAAVAGQVSHVAIGFGHTLHSHEPEHHHVVHNFHNTTLGKEFLSVQHAEKKLRNLTKDNVPDIQVSELMVIDFAHRKINQGEKDMLLKGSKLEKEGDTFLAQICFTRAGAHSKQPHIGKMLLGNLMYKQGKLLTSLGLYNAAIKLLQDRKGFLRMPADEHMAHHNRAIIAFRLGDDHQGLADLETAVNLASDNMESKEMLALVKRRMGKFHSAIEDTIANKVSRLERKRTDLMDTVQSLKPKERTSVVNKKKEKEKPSTLDMIKALPILHSDSVQPRRRANVDGENPTNRMASIDSSNPTLHGGVIPTRVQDTRGFVLQLNEPCCYTSFKDKIAIGHKSRSELGSTQNDDDDGGGGQLKVFKLNRGMKLNLFDELFVAPTLLQAALLRPPHHRMEQDLDEISAALRLFPALRDLHPGHVRELADLVEYRALSSKDNLFFQNGIASATVLLLKGSVVVNMEYEAPIAPVAVTSNEENSSTNVDEKEKENTDVMVVGHNDFVVGHLENYATFGHIDFLFQHHNETIKKELEEIVYPPHIRVQDVVAVSQSYGDTTDQQGSSLVAEIPSRLGANIEDLDRSVGPGMFASYTMQQLCEVMLINARAMERILLPTAFAALRSRLDVVTACKIFDKWTRNDHIRLARMGQERTFARGETILKQGEKPMYIYLIMKGLCNVHKRPNRTQMLIEHLADLHEKIKRHDSQYVFDHGLTNVLTKADVLEFRQACESYYSSGLDAFDETVIGDFAHYQQVHNKRNKLAFQAMALQYPHITQSELDRYKMTLEVSKYEDLIQRATMMDAKERHSEDQGARNKSIGTLQWPMIFGEACVLDPEAGVSKGTITADTSVDVFVLHKTQLQTFPIDTEFLDRVTCKAILYPTDPDIAVSLYKEKEWTGYRKKVMKGIRTSRWPTPPTLLDPFSVC